MNNKNVGMLFITSAIIMLVVIAAIVIIILLILKQRRINKSEDAKAMEEIEKLEEKIENENVQGVPNYDTFQTQILLLLNQIKTSAEHTERHMVFFKTLAIISIMLAVFAGFITVVSMFAK